ncbi:DUF4190 domain-containing protein [Blastococcus mobilis]|uniref:DUF4190 domain-containing protein n=1 Tax=Blastococcus mobilis TaxID=1938746 RepID=A0A238XVJ2_9ACTN|nr:DUF4190 domain-containing protein [Blastococcus mobilis]SNR62354.1 protein of unknown function [Blastococcus mobilis]
MSSSDEHPYRGAPPPPPPESPAGGQGAPGYPPPGYAAPVHPGPGYAAPGYGQPYGPPGYGPPGYPPVHVRPTNTMAILALVLAFVFAPAGLVLGIVARRQIRRTGEDGDGLALAGIIVGGIVTAIFVFFILLWIIAFAAFTGTGSFGP